jgi:hypothetical protein
MIKKTSKITCEILTLLYKKFIYILSFVLLSFATEINAAENLEDNKQSNEEINESSNATNLPDWLKRTSFNLQKKEGQIRPAGRFATIQPIYKQDNDVFYGEFGIGQDYTKSDKKWRTATNIGIGNKKIFLEDTLLVGLNSFCDYEAPYNHSRGSLGIGLSTVYLDLHTNAYLPISKKKYKNNAIERALKGFDYEVGVPLPYAPWGRAYYKNYFWENKSLRDTNGHRIGIELSTFPFVKLDAKYDKSNNTKGSFSAMFTFSMGFDGPNLYSLFKNNSLFSSQAYQNNKVENKLLDQTHRMNAITVERASANGYKAVKVE